MANPGLCYAGLIGQEDAVARLRAFTDLFASSGTTPGRYPPDRRCGMGQTTIAMTVANERNVGFSEVNAASFVVQGDFTAVVTNLRKDQVLMLSDLQLLRKPICDKLKDVMRDAKLTINIGTGPSARTHVMDVQQLTVIATCSKKSDCQ